MSLAGLLDDLKADAGIAAILRAGDRGDAELEISAPDAMQAPLVAAIAQLDPSVPVLAITATVRESEALAASLAAFAPDSVALFPAWETLPHERLSPRSDTVGQRLATLRRLVHPDHTGERAHEAPVQVVVAPIRALLQPFVAGLAELSPVAAQAGVELGLEAMTEQLAAAAYTRVELVERRGEFAVRGGIVDVFPPTEEHPLRIEFWGDTVEEVRWFRVADQRTLEVAPDGLWAPPCRELLLTEHVRDRAAELAVTHPGLAEVFTKLAAGIAVDGMESLAPVLAGDLQLLLDVLPTGTRVVICDPERGRTRAADLVATSADFLAASWANAAAGGEAPLDLGAASFRSIAEVRAHALTRDQAWWTISPFAVDEDFAADVLRVGATEVPSYRGDTDRALTDIAEWLRSGWRVTLVTEGHGPAQRLVERLSDAELPARLVSETAAAAGRDVISVTTGTLDRGFLLPELRVAVLTESDLVGQKATTKDMRRLPSRRRGLVDPLELKVGDYVVHDQHGVGRYVEMIERTVQGATREYLIVEYAPAKRGQPGDRLFVPMDQLEQLTKYVGGESPTIHRLGGADWQKAKGRARKAVKQIAAELIRLYSARMAAQGHAFAPDSPWQRELEDAFPYAETPDQLACIDEVKADMERVVPMDRLICGDVGYGKTEIAVRAAFKAVQDGKQVAILVPTTLLVQQHLSTFQERYATFPIQVRPLSRFQSDKEIAETTTGLLEGSVDIVIGTHRLITGAVQFRDLGLVIIDEEQRFGVEHKEHLKALRTSVDVLAMSATPIPRTLEMAVTGIREMSTIQTPPEERHPVLTYVGAYDERQIAAAIRRELLRDGQIFYVHNRVASINRVAAHLAELVPEARIGVAHGQLPEETLERVIQGFWEKEFDVLLSTTIVESGIDIPNANTLILDRADSFGLSQLHQIRGRVGRGRERAYAYFMYPPEKPLTETAHDRLATIAQHTDLGAGMRVAMKDLEIRGAGNLLGGEQSGHIANVGFDLYVRLVGEAVAEFKGDQPAVAVDVKVEIPVDAHLPHDYITHERLRLEAYRRVAEATQPEEISAVRDELRDRYGEPPAPVDALLAVAAFRGLAQAAGLHEVVAQGNYIKVAPVELAESATLRVQRLYPKSLVKPALRTLLVPRPTSSGGTPLRNQDLLDWCRDLVHTIQPPVASTGSGSMEGTL